VLLEAIEKGFVTRDFVAEEVKNGHVRPSLLAQVDLKIADPLLLPRSARALDRNYLPPHVIASSASRSGERPSLRSIALKRRARMLAWRVMTRLGLWEAVKKLRGRIKAARQNGRIASARRRRGMSAT
jgi:hypothetical protein